MGHELVRTFAQHMRAEDQLILCDPVYFGGTVDRSVGSAELVADIVAMGRQAAHIPERAECGDRLAALAQAGDRIVIMGARDDTLSAFAADILAKLGR